MTLPPQMTSYYWGLAHQRRHLLSRPRLQLLEPLAHALLPLHLLLLQGRLPLQHLAQRAGSTIHWVFAAAGGLVRGWDMLLLISCMDLLLLLLPSQQGLHQQDGNALLPLNAAGQSQPRKGSARGVGSQHAGTHREDKQAAAAKRHAGVITLEPQPCHPSSDAVRCRCCHSGSCCCHCCFWDNHNSTRAPCCLLLPSRSPVCQLLFSFHQLPLELVSSLALLAQLGSGGMACMAAGRHSAAHTSSMHHYHHVNLRDVAWLHS